LGLWAAAVPLGAVEYGRTNVLAAVTEGALREAIEEAVTSRVATRITAKTPGIVVLTNPLVLAGRIWLDLPGTSLRPGGNTEAVLVPTNGDARISGLSISGFTASKNAVVHNEGILGMEDCELSDNRNEAGGGGAIDNKGNLLVSGCKILRNRSNAKEWAGMQEIGGFGGGIRQRAGYLTVADSVIEGNTTRGSFFTTGIGGDFAVYGGGLGGGLYVEGGTAVLNRVSIVGNLPAMTGRPNEDRGRYWMGTGLFVAGGETMATNCTFALNAAQGHSSYEAWSFVVPSGDSEGGGIAVKGGRLVLAHCTITQNSSTKGIGSPSAFGSTSKAGGISVLGGRLEMAGCIVHGNDAESSRDISGQFLDLGGNLIGTTDILTNAYFFAPLGPIARSSSGQAYYELPRFSAARDISVARIDGDILAKRRPVGDFADAGSVEGDPVQPVIGSQIPPKIVLTPDSRETLKIESFGTSRIWHELWRDGALVLRGTNSVFSFSGPEMAGIYFVRVFNEFGESSSALFQVEFRSSLTFVRQPAWQKTSRGGSVRFEVELTGNPDMQFQWYRNGTALAGGTNAVLEVNNVQEAELGTYVVEVRTGPERVLSDPALLEFWPQLLVTSLDDSGIGSLRRAVERANLTGKPDLRTIAIGRNGTIQLESPLVIKANMEIAVGSNRVVINGNGVTRLIRVETNGSAKLRNLVLVSGKAPGNGLGGAVWNEGVLHLEGCSLSNHSAVLGGAILNRGGLFVSGGEIIDCTAQGERGGDGNGAGGGGGGLGGAIYCERGSVRLVNVQMFNNRAIGNSGGQFTDWLAAPGLGGNTRSKLAIGAQAPFGIGGSGGTENQFTNYGRPPIIVWAWSMGDPAGFGGGGGGGHTSMYGGFGLGSGPGFGGGSGAAGNGGGGAGLGGAVFVEAGTVEMAGTSLHGNTVQGGFGLTNGMGAGAGIFVHGGTVRISGSRIYGNAALRTGSGTDGTNRLGVAGGIYVYGGEVRMGGSEVFGNSADEKPEMQGLVVSEGGNIWPEGQAGAADTDRVGKAFLAVERGAGGVELLWPTNFAGAVLERSRGGAGWEWEPVPGAPRQEGGIYRMAPAGNRGPEFFRLRGD